MRPTSNRKDLISRYATAIIAGLASEVSAVTLKHKLTQGELVEHFVRDVLGLFLTSQFDAGSGIIINYQQDESDQTDIVTHGSLIF